MMINNSETDRQTFQKRELYIVIDMILCKTTIRRKKKNANLKKTVKFEIYMIRFEIIMFF